MVRKKDILYIPFQVSLLYIVKINYRRICI